MQKIYVPSMRDFSIFLQLDKQYSMISVEDDNFTRVEVQVGSEPIFRTNINYELHRACKNAIDLLKLNFRSKIVNIPLSSL